MGNNSMITTNNTAMTDAAGDIFGKERHRKSPLSLEKCLTSVTEREV